MKESNNTFTTSEKFLNEYEWFVDAYKEIITNKNIEPIINQIDTQTAMVFAWSAAVQDILQHTIIEWNKWLLRKPYQIYTRLLINHMVNRKKWINIDPSNLQKIQKNLKRRKKRLEHNNDAWDEDNFSGIVSIFEQD